MVLGPTGGTYITESKLNDNIRLGLLQNKNDTSISFTITQDLLNELLMNVTLSAITSYGLWNTTTNVTVETLVSTYNFSSPINLIIPYFLILFIALPFTLLCLWALYSNGFGANDGGFIQFITTTRSASLEREAVLGSLGANISPKLRDLRIRYGELIEGHGKGEKTRDVRMVRRAGFGTEDETLPLERGTRYGRPSSIDSEVDGFDADWK